MKIYIPDIDFANQNKKLLFILTRPFYKQTHWENSDELKQRFQLTQEFIYVNNIKEADVFFIPKPINRYTEEELSEINKICKQNNIKAFGYISGDLGKKYPEFEQLTYFRMGGFRSQLSQKNRAFPVLVSDHSAKIYQDGCVEIRPKQDIPVVGFCGQASLSQTKRIKENLRFIRENIERFFKKPFRKDYEPLFPSAYQRAKLLKIFESSHKISTNFIYRKQYRAGALTGEKQTATTLEYYDNIKNSDYILCVRGAGNFSLRLYETLMMGRIPVFVNTDCLLPFDDIIDWSKHMVRVEWKDRKNIADKVAEFHQKLSGKDFEDLQHSNRKLWKENLSVNNMLKMVNSFPGRES